VKVWRVCIADALGAPTIALVTEVDGRVFLAHCSTTGCGVNPAHVHPVRAFPALAQKWLDGVLANSASAAKFPVDAVPPVAERPALLTAPAT
jgi:hypothetical protein